MLYDFELVERRVRLWKRPGESYDHVLMKALGNIPAWRSSKRSVSATNPTSWHAPVAGGKFTSGVNAAG